MHSGVLAMRAPGTGSGIRRRASLVAATAIAALAAGVVALASAIGHAQTPLPQRQDRAVYDLAGVIEPAHASAIEAVNRELWQKARVAIVVLTVPALQDETIDELAVRLGHTWGIGGEGQDRGLVIAFAERDRRIFVATGYGTEGYLPDGRVGALMDRHAIPFLRANRFSEGLYRLDLALAAASAEEYGVTLTGAPAGLARGREPAPELGPMQIVFGILMLIALAYLAIRHPRLFFFLLLTMGGNRDRGGSGFGGGGGGFGGGGGGFGGGGAGRGF